ncbi:unnamed protein product, partial [marine sediment metagenome]
MASWLYGTTIDFISKPFNSELRWFNAARYGIKASIFELISEDIDVNIQDDDGKTALILASFYGHQEVVEILIHNGVDVNIQSISGYTASALIYATLIR